MAAASDRDVAREDRSARGLAWRARVQVMDGNYQLMRGRVPWWDGVSKAG